MFKKIYEALKPMTFEEFVESGGDAADFAPGGGFIFLLMIILMVVGFIASL